MKGKGKGYGKNQKQKNLPVLMSGRKYSNQTGKRTTLQQADNYVPVTVRNRKTGARRPAESGRIAANNFIVGSHMAHDLDIVPIHKRIGRTSDAVDRHASKVVRKRRKKP